MVDDSTPARTYTRLHLALQHPIPGRLTLLRYAGLAALWPPRDPEPLLRRYALDAEPVTLGLTLLASAAFKRKLLEAAARQIDLRPDGLRLLVPGIVEDPEYLAFLFNLLSDAARLLEGAHAADAQAEVAAQPHTLVEA